jgi:tRNA-(ms[2]io[6]A)-hydroxylase
MLQLQSATSPEWVKQAVQNIDVILLDHAHCEKKAASTALNLIFRYPHHTELVRALSEVAREELEHFELVLDHLEARGTTFERLAPSTYAGKLLTVMRSDEPHRLIDMLLCCAMIEARSCERMGLLGDALTDPALSKLYQGLLASEARHHMLYIDLACHFAVESDVRKRLEFIAKHESGIISGESTVPRMHN